MRLPQNPMASTLRCAAYDIQYADHARLSKRHVELAGQALRPLFADKPWVEARRSLPQMRP
jgi:hypothetical protein